MDAIFGFFDSIINKPLGFVLRYCYMLLKNYGLSIILLTIITKAILIPVDIKRHKNMLHGLIFQPRVAELQKKYGKDRQKLAEEMQKLTDEGYNPMGGCLPMLVQFPIIIGLYQVISKPLTYIAQISNDVMKQIAEILITARAAGFEKLADDVVSEKTKLVDAVNSVVNSGQSNLVNALNNNFAGIRDLVPNYTNLDFNMLGLNLAAIPEKFTTILGIIPIPALTWLAIIPILSGITAYLSAIISQKYMVMPTDPNNPQAKSMQKMTVFIMPAISYGIAMSVPAGVGLYWIMSNIIAAFQAVALYKIYNPQEFLAKAKEEEEQRKAKKKALQQKQRENQED